jgi:DNA-binding LacI/PurR family transcriptional regulator
VASSGVPKRPTSTDVAREAGLSRSTVSYVLNDDPNQKIPEVTRQRVFAAAAKLGYTPSAAARALRSGRSELVLCLLPDWPLGPSLGSLLEHLSAGLESHGLTLLLHPRVHSTRPTSALWRSISPAAVLLFEDISDEEKAAMRAAGIKLTVAVLSGGRRHNGKSQYYEQALGRLQLEHLAATGHRYIGYAYPDDARVRSFADPRLEAVRMACVDLDLAAPDVQVVPLDPKAAEESVRAWKALRPRVTAVCAYNDEVAMAVLAAAHRLGVRVPQDLAVIGVDDIPTAAVTQPPLTTVSRDIALYADAITRNVARAVEGMPPIRRWPHPNPVVLVRRESA